MTGTVHGDDLGLFIGHHGQTIDAVQHLALRHRRSRDGDGARATAVVVDAEGYRARRARGAASGQADEAADEALRFKGARWRSMR